MPRGSGSETDRGRPSAAYGRVAGYVVVLLLLGVVFFLVGWLVGPVAPELRPGWHYPEDGGSHALGGLR
ncbi:hypothetical protein ACFCX4_35710 [Kitasatospora sp. NPDC056327]|uniref:hypothetical protein n=1 Tax=Kitasatospora sp. NPDC056327 TaxID=3345785 RepID=UPI0035DC9EB0